MQIIDSTRDRIYVVCLCSFVALILALPVFPSGDGSVHLYYSHILGSLLSRPGVYGQEYLLRRIAGPYFLQYFFQAAMERIVGANTAEKLFVALILLNLGLGFRFLARQLGENSSLASLWALSLLPVWTLATGFMNYSLAIGFALWALGFWHSLKRSGPIRNAAWFSLMGIALVFSHPLPLLLLISLIGFDLVVIVLNGLRKRKAFPARMLLLVVSFLLVCVAFIVPILISDKSRIKGEAQNLGFHLGVFINFLQANTVTIIGKDHYSLTIYQHLFRVLLGILLLLTLSRIVARWRNPDLFENDGLAIAAVLLIVMTFFLPVSLNAGYYVPQRIWEFLWLIALASVAAWRISEKWRAFLTMASILFFLFTLGEAASALYLTSRTVKLIDSTLLPSAAHGIYLAADDTNQYPNGLSWATYGWSGARAFEHSGAVLVNSPWLDTTIAPLQAKNHTDISRFYMSFSGTPNEPNLLLNKMLVNEDYRNGVLSLADFVFYVDPSGNPQTIATTTSRLFLNAGNDWSCMTEPIGSLCVRQGRSRVSPASQPHLN